MALADPLQSYAATTDDPPRLFAANGASYMIASIYLHILPGDLLGVVLNYVLYDIRQEYLSTLALFNQPLFAHLTSGPMWSRLRARRAEVMYRTYWSSNDYTAARFLAYDGTIVL